jgi:pSer/pThr/pTyr-binding forkhead associated (FHA) protein
VSGTPILIPHFDPPLAFFDEGANTVIRLLHMPAIRVKLPGNEKESVIPLVGHRITVGRAPNNTLQILSPTMSLRHAELIFEGDHYRVRDLGSTNGVFVDEKQVTDFTFARLAS